MTLPWKYLHLHLPKSFSFTKGNFGSNYFSSKEASSYSCWRDCSWVLLIVCLSKFQRSMVDSQGLAFYIPLSFLYLTLYTPSLSFNVQCRYKVYTFLETWGVAGDGATGSCSLGSARKPAPGVGRSLTSTKAGLTAATVSTTSNNRTL